MIISPKEMEEIDKVRLIQDKIIAGKITKRFVEDMGGDYPLFGEGTPTYNQLCSFIYPGMVDRMESFLSNLNHSR